MSEIHNILVVEDDPDGQELVTHILEHMGATIDVVGNGDHALEHLRKSTYQAVIVDLALPDMDGWALLKEIQADPQLANTLCIAMTAFHTSRVREDALKAGFRAYFPKPLDAARLIQEIEQLLV
jgi:two-component system, sensor histidine kinase and response regulator